MTVRFGDVIEIELPNTWPDELRCLLDDNLDLLRAYESEWARIDRLYDEDVLARVTPQHNPHKAARDELIERVDSLLADKDLLGFHCTRLAEDEATAIKADGLSESGLRAFPSSVLGVSQSLTVCWLILFV